MKLGSRAGFCFAPSKPPTSASSGDCSHMSFLPIRYSVDRWSVCDNANNRRRFGGYAQNNDRAINFRFGPFCGCACEADLPGKHGYDKCLLALHRVDQGSNTKHV